MGLRVCLVTPFAWSRPHDVNEHVAGVAAGLRALGHTVTVLAPSTRAADLIAGGRLQLGISRGSPEQVIEGYKYFGYDPGEGNDHADMARA